MDPRAVSRRLFRIAASVVAGLMVCLSVHAAPASRLDSLDIDTVHKVFPQADRISARLDVAPARAAFSGSELLGWVFLSDEVHPVPAYSGKPIAVLVGLQPDARIAGATIVAHEEPILVIGVKDADLQKFIGQYAGIGASESVRVGAAAREGYRGIDAITGATITVMVLNQSLMRSAQAVAAALGLPLAPGAAAAAELTAAHAEPTAAPLSRMPAAGVDTMARDGEPEWQQLWQERRVRVVVLVAALGLLVAMLVFQDWLVLRPRLFRRLRTGYLLFTVLFVGIYSMGQLSIVNMLAFGRVMAGGFSWDTLLLEPITFLLWGFVAVTIILWGRGVYCGWLCPFGALQELIHSVAERFKLPTWEFPAMVHERLWAIKYLILILLFGLSLDSMARAATVAEVEPFKTVFGMHFMREWYFTLYALGLLAISAVNSKFYCKYLCPLGAALSFFTRFRIFDWLRRRRECGSPCQTCAAQCQIGAIRPTGEIIENECHYCLECQVIYHDDHRCPPLVEKRKRREKREANAAGMMASGRKIDAVQVD
ncbi:MAG: 4Fe-4S binding protein [Pseudomonadales bacterium]|nr:4Fe-4S binding protein [Pseudomonadales bacterium]